MSIEFTCPNGHKLTVKDEHAGKSGLCPRCQAKVRVPEKEDLDDDIFSMLGEPDSTLKPEQEDVVLSMSSAAKRSKICPGCGGQTSYAFTICPTCGTPLPTTASPSRPK